MTESGYGKSVIAIGTLIPESAPPLEAHSGLPELEERLMSISMDRAGAEGDFTAYGAYQDAVPRVAVFQLQCRSCGFEPENAVVAPKICPKCHGESWERFARPGSILENATR